MQKGVNSYELTPFPCFESLTLKRRLSTLPLLRSTIGVVGLNFSVRNGKRWIPNAITTLIPFNFFKMFDLGQRYFISNLRFMACIATCHLLIYQSFLPEKESLGLLVLLGCDITALTPVAYQRCSLQRPLREILS